ncbi:MAG: alpha-amylase family glycosyl hydrolase [Pseudomonadota bacterium]|nr:alpha-amylase family glycosyl hydrolase [Pseudomonadota bacterium]
MDTDTESSPTLSGHWPACPVVYEINTLVWLLELSQRAGKALTLAEVPDDELARLAGLGIDAVWLMGVWQRSSAARKVARERPDLQASYRQALPDYTGRDVVGSPYAVYSYTVDASLGGNEALALLRRRLHGHGLRLILDFVPNHLAVDHPWVKEHPERLVEGSPDQLEREPQNFFTCKSNGHVRILAHGRDPHFDGWSDTVQLDFRRRDTQEAMIEALVGVTAHCDGVRCDMAMLVNQDVFLRTWGGSFGPDMPGFWPAAIAAVKFRQPHFLMLAEAYWDLEWKLQQLGFDYTYDKRLYDRLRWGDAVTVRQHLVADLVFQRHLARFIENHDEERAMHAFPVAADAGAGGGTVCATARVRAAAVLTFTLPGLRLLHEGQLEGRRVRLPVQLRRRPPEPPEPGLEGFYRGLLAALRHSVFRDGRWRLLESRPAWGDNPSHESCIGFHWTLDAEHRLVVVNLASHPSQCYLPLTGLELGGRAWRLQDLLGEMAFERDGDTLLEPGLYLDLPAYAGHVFELRPF